MKESQEEKGEKEEEEEEEKEDEYNMSYKSSSLYVQYNDRTLKVEPFAWYLLGKGFKANPVFQRRLCSRSQRCWEVLCPGATPRP